MVNQSDSQGIPPLEHCSYFLPEALVLQTGVECGKFHGLFLPFQAFSSQAVSAICVTISDPDVGLCIHNPSGGVAARCYTGRPATEARHLEVSPGGAQP